MTFSRLAETMAPSEILQIGNDIRQRMSGGDAINNFTMGDFDPAIFPIPQQLEEGIIQAYRDHLTAYPLAEGNLDLRQAIKKYCEAFQRLRYEENEILVGSGGRPLIYAVFLALCDPGDTIIYPVPSWNNNYYAHLVSGHRVILETKEENKFMPLASDIRPYIGMATLLALCSPQNPTGTTFTRDQLKEICDMVVEENERRPPGRRKLFILFDQMYSQLVYGTAIHYNPVGVSLRVRPYTITVDAISKSFAATGVRVGWCLGPAPLISTMKVLLTHIGAWAPMPEQKGLAGFLVQSDAIRAFLSHFKNELHGRLQYLFAGIMQLKREGYPVDAIAPEAAVFLSVKIGVAGKNAREVTRFLLEVGNVAVVPFYAFGSEKNDSWFRLSVGSCRVPEMDTVLLALRHAMDCHPAKAEGEMTPAAVH